jgi:subtilisin family serine protease
VQRHAHLLWSKAKAAMPACAVLALALSGSSARATDPWYDDRVQLQLAPGIDIDEINSEYGTTTDDSLPPLFLLAVPDGVPQQQILLQMSSDPRIEWAEPGYLDETPETTRLMFVIIVGGTVTDYEDQAVLDRIRLDDILPHTTGSGVTVAVLDTGVESAHPALAGSVMKGGFDFVDDDIYPEDTANGLDDDGDGHTDEGAGHGTMVAGIVHLIAPDAEILPLRILDDEGRGTSFAVARALVFAVDAGAQVINMSFGLPLHCNTIAWGIEYAAEAGVVLVGAAGNDGTEFPPYYPASDPAVLSVTALDSTDVKSSFSNYHSTVAVSAPGNGILSPFPGGQYAIGAGTSFAAPFISGQAALVQGGPVAPMKSGVDTVIRNGVVEIDEIPGNVPFAGKLGSGRFDGLETWLAMSPAAQVPIAPAGSLGWSVFPNPSSVSQSVTISARALEQATGAATVHDLAGRIVAKLPHAGATLTWDGRDLRGREAPSGFYQVRIQTDRGPETISLLRMR